jgi:UDP-galactopyranose mutase
MKYDYVIVGSGFYGATFARLMTDAGRLCLVLESRKHIGGNAYTKKIEDIDVHMYGPHIFHTDNSEIWQFVNKFARFNNYIHMPKAIRGDRLYSLPFNMNTFYEIWGETDPYKVQEIIQQQSKSTTKITNLEEQAISLVGQDVYDLLIRDYTKKQWQRDPTLLPAWIIKRLPIRYTYDNRYFDDRYQGIPESGYTDLFQNMMQGIEVKTDVDYFENKTHWDQLAKSVVYTGKIDEFFGYEYGELEYRTLSFETKVLDINNYQGCAVINNCDPDRDYTRTIEHRHFAKSQSSKTVVTWERPVEWDKRLVPYYPINDDQNTNKFRQYQDRARTLKNVIIGGRLGEYRYYDMHQVIGSAMKTVRDLLST